jgi:hypothetical protein
MTEQRVPNKQNMLGTRGQNEQFRPKGCSVVLPVPSEHVTSATRRFFTEGKKEQSPFLTEEPTDAVYRRFPPPTADNPRPLLPIGEER